jgi:hypothetical protein
MDSKFPTLYTPNRLRCSRKGRKLGDSADKLLGEGAEFHFSANVGESSGNVSSGCAVWRVADKWI